MLDGLNSYKMNQQRERMKDSFIFYIGHFASVALRFVAQILASFIKEFVNSFKTIFHM